MVRRGRKQFENIGTTYFITTTVINFLKLFSKKDDYYDILIDNLRFYINKYNITLLGYVLMPNHLHLLILIPEGRSVSDFMRDFKKYTSLKIKEKLIKDGKSMIIDKLRNLSGTGNFKLWMDRFDSIPIGSTHVLETKLNYIHYNPVKAGLVKEMIDWKYSSARNYYLEDHSIIYVSIDWDMKE
jgi:putative transposase